MREMRLFLLLFAIAAATPAFGGSVAGFNDALTAYQASVQADDWEAALAASTSLLDEASGVLPNEDERWAVLYVNHATAMAQAGRRDEAAPWFEKAYAKGRSVWGEDAPELIPFMKAEASAFIDPSESEPARKRFQRAIDATAAHFGDESLEYAALSLDAGRAMIDKCFSVRGEGWVEDAFAIYQRSGDGFQDQAAIAAFYLGKHRIYRGDESMAIDYLERAVDTLGAATPETKELAAHAHATLLSLYNDRGEPALAARHERAIATLGAEMQQMDFLPVKRVAPTYPRDALLDGLEAYVDLVYTVTAAGTVEDIVATDARVNRKGQPEGTVDVRDTRDGRRFVKEAKRAARKFEYTPRFIDGKAIPVPGVRLRVRFQLD